MYSKKNRTQKALVKLLKKGDMTAFDAIYAKYSHRLFGFVLRYTKNREDAEEIVQEIFVKIWVTRSSINENSSFESFLFTIAYNTTISVLRKRVNENKYVAYLKSIQQISSDDNVINDISYNELRNKIDSLLTRLTPRQRQIFQLSREEGLTHSEIAQKLNISKSTVKNHMVSTLSLLRSGMGKGLLISALYCNLFL